MVDTQMINYGQYVEIAIQDQLHHPMIPEKLIDINRYSNQSIVCSSSKAPKTHYRKHQEQCSIHLAIAASFRSPTFLHKCRSMINMFHSLLVVVS